MSNTDSIWSGAFWKAATERSVRTAAQAGLAYLGTGGLLDALTITWGGLGGVALGGALLSYLTSLAANAGTGTGPSFTSAEITASTTQDQLKLGQAMPYADEHPDGTGMPYVVDPYESRGPDNDPSLRPANPPVFGTSLAEREAADKPNPEGR